MRRPAGLLVPLTTPFDKSSGDVAPVDLRQHARATLDAGVDGLVVGGSTGEGPLLDAEEYGQMLAWLRDVVPADRWLIAGAGRESTRATVAACQVAAEHESDAVLVRPPSYYASSMTRQVLIDHFRRVADASPVPVFLYNIPKYTHVSLTDGLLGALADHENVWGAKDSSGDLKNFASYRDAVPHWTFFVGSGALFYAALELGAAGAIAGVGCFAPAQLVEIKAAFAAGDKERAGAIQEVAAPLHKEIVAGLGVPGVKAAVDMVGLPGGRVRPPLVDLSERERKKVKQLLSTARLLST